MSLITIFGLWFLLAILISRNRPSVRRFALKRLVWVPILFIPIWFGTYSMMKAAPGDPVYIIAGSHASEEVLEATREAYGLNRPHLVQFADDTWKQTNGNSGDSFIFPGKTVAQLAAERIPYSFAITFPSLLIILAMGLTVGLWATFKKGTWLDTFLLSSALFWQAFPSLILIQFLMLVFSVKLGWLPVGWSGDWTAVFTTTAIIPIVTMSLGGIAGMARLGRTGKRKASWDALGTFLPHTRRIILCGGIISHARPRVKSLPQSSWNSWYEIVLLTQVSFATVSSLFIGMGKKNPNPLEKRMSPGVYSFFPSF